LLSIGRACAIAGIVWLHAQLLVATIRDGTYLDLGSFIAAGEAANLGGNPYSDDGALIFNVPFQNQSVPAPNLNPPITVHVFQALAHVDPDTSTVAWRAVSLIGYVVIVLWLWRANRLRRMNHVVAVLLLDGFWSTILLGQLYIALLIPVAAAYLLLPRRPVAAGVCMGIAMAVKPQFLLCAALLLCARYWRAALSSGATAAGLSILPLLTGHTDWYIEWIQASTSHPIFAQFPNNMALSSLLARTGFDPWVWPVVAVGVLAALMFVTARGAGPRRAYELGTVGTLLLSPISWTGYAIFLMPIFLARKEWPRLMTISWVCFLVPTMVLMELPALGAIPTAGLVLFAATLVREEMRPTLNAPVPWHSARITLRERDGYSPLSETTSEPLSEPSYSGTRIASGVQR
jgi:hypothetical protein